MSKFARRAGFSGTPRFVIHATSALARGFHGERDMAIVRNMSELEGRIYTRSTACNLADWGTADVYYLEDRG